MQYTKGSIIYFEGDHDERIFIMQQGAVLLTSTDIESGQPVAEQVKSGEFFGVKSALGHFRREETATALVPTVAVALTIQEFEILFSNNKALIMKMLRVFSNQLRQIHKRLNQSSIIFRKISSLVCWLLQRASTTRSSSALPATFT